MKKVSQGLYTENEFWVLSAKGSYSKRRIYGRSSRKVDQKVMARKEEKDQDPAFARGQKAKVLQHGKMTSKTQLSGEKARAKEKVKRGKKGMMKGKDSFKGMPSWKGKEKVMRRTKEETIHFVTTSTS